MEVRVAPGSNDDPGRLLAESIRAAVSLSHDEGSTALARLRADVAAGNVPAGAAADAGLHLLRGLREGDGVIHDMAFAALLLDFGEERHIAPLRALSLRTRSGMRDWRLEVSRALGAMTARVEGRCVCAVEAGNGVPPHGAAWRVESTRDDPAAWSTIYQVVCTGCGRRWSVVEESGYHYPLFRWTAAPGAAPDGG